MNLRTRVVDAMAKRFNLTPLLLLTLTCFFCCCCSMISSSSSQQASSSGFLQCVTEANISVSEHGDDLFDTLVDRYIRNPKFLANTTVRPLYVVTPANASHVQAAVRCGSLNGMPLRVRSGGHDFEGLSYRSVRAEGFAMLDMSELRTVLVDNLTSTAWVESGATLGELYYAISKASNVLGFPAGVCSTVGVGGHFSGGGFGTLMRKHGLAVDNIIDAELVAADGTLLNKTTMGDDVFWAIRGGGGGSFGVVLKWRVRLVTVPATVSVFMVSVSNSQGAAVDAVTKWQKVAPALPNELYIEVFIENNAAVFRAVFLGTCDALLPAMSKSDGILPELLNLSRSDCKEMSWIQSVAYVYKSTSTVEELPKRTASEFDSRHGFKATTDYVRQPIRREVWAKIFDKQLAQPMAQIGLVPYGGKMGNVPEDATPYPHRAGVLYSMQLYNYWPVDSAADGGAVQSKWVRNMYAFMAPYMSSGSNPRGAYFNCRDLDLGADWGLGYFKGNYERLTKAKAQIDPHNYFSNEQSIPLPKQAHWHPVATSSF